MISIFKAHHHFFFGLIAAVLSLHEARENFFNHLITCTSRDLCSKTMETFQLIAKLQNNRPFSVTFQTFYEFMLLWLCFTPLITADTAEWYVGFLCEPLPWLLGLPLVIRKLSTKFPSGKVRKLRKQHSAHHTNAHTILMKRLLGLFLIRFSSSYFVFFFFWLNEIIFPIGAHKSIERWPAFGHR